MDPSSLSPRAPSTWTLGVSCCGATVELKKLQWPCERNATRNQGSTVTTTSATSSGNLWDIKVNPEQRGRFSDISSCRISGNEEHGGIFTRKILRVLRDHLGDDDFQFEDWLVAFRHVWPLNVDFHLCSAIFQLYLSIFRMMDDPKLGRNQLEEYYDEIIAALRTTEAFWVANCKTIGYLSTIFNDLYPVSAGEQCMCIRRHVCY